MTTTDTTGKPMAAAGRRVLLQSSGNVNIIDGSTIWLISMAELFARTGAHVTLLLNSGIHSTRMLAPIMKLPTVRVVNPFEGRNVSPSTLLTHEEAAELAVELDREAPFDVVVTRGRAVCDAFARTGRFDGRMWSYVIDLPEAGANPSGADLLELQEIALASQKMLVQTEDSRSYAEFRVPASVGKCLVTYPVIPDDLKPLPTRRTTRPGQLRGVYSGKFAEGWKTLELCELPARVRDLGVDLTISLIGDKFMQFPHNPTWRPRMQQAVRTSPGIEWAGGMSREDANAYTRTADIGFSWRSQALDSTHELSTKVLEYCALGVAPVLNGIAAHVELLGPDYPLFVTEDVRSVEAALARVARDPDLLDAARERALAAVDYFRMSRAAERIGAALAAAPRAASTDLASSPPPQTLLVGEHLKSARAVHSALATLPTGVRVGDWWSRGRGHEEARKDELHSAASIVLDGAEPYLPWVVSRIRPDQALVVRVAAPSRDLNVLRGPALDRVDAVVVETSGDEEIVLGTYPELAGKVAVIAPAVDTAYFDRADVPGRAFRIGMLDVWPATRRPDAAVRLLRELLDRDPRFSLHLRSSRPWDDPERWEHTGERDYYGALLGLVESDPVLRTRVGFEDEGADLPGWYRTMGWLFQPRRDGGPVDVRTVEAQAAGVIVVSPVESDAVELFGQEQAFEDIPALAKHVLTTATGDGTWLVARDAARQRAARHDVHNVAKAWEAVIAEARARRP